MFIKGVFNKDLSFKMNMFQRVYLLAYTFCYNMMDYRTINIGGHELFQLNDPDSLMYRS